MPNFQRTLKQTISFTGVGLHTGVTTTVEIRPAAANTGIVFQRVDLPNKPYIQANTLSVYDTSLATRIGTPEVHVSTIEHLMAAFFGFGIDNAVVAIDNYEMPILDGSAAPFLVLLDEAGVVELNAPRQVVVIEKAIEVFDENNPTRFIRVEPSKHARISYVIDFGTSNVIGRQQVTLNYDAKTFCEEFAVARTFCLKEEIEFMQARGLARGGSLDNALVVSRTDGVVNANGLRNEKEFVKHKVLDCIGDLHLLGMPIVGHVIAHKAGHDLHNKLAKAILMNTAARKIVVPASNEVARFKEVLSFPSTLSDIQASLINLSTG